MSAKWNNNKIDLDILANRLNKRLDSLSSGFSLMDSVTADLFTVIYSSLEFDSKIPEIEKRNIVTKGITSAIDKGGLNGKLILGEISREENSYNKLTPKKFVLVTSLSISTTTKLRHTNLLGNTIKFSNGLPKKFNNYSIIREAVDNKLFPEYAIPHNFNHVRVFVKARTIHEAYLLAMDTLDLLRGIWNFYLNLSVGRRWSFGGSNKVNKITLGPIHTIHNSNGKLATENYWFESNYNYDSSTFSSMTNQYEKIRRFEKHIRSQLKNSNYKSDLINFLLKYTRALDGSDLNNAFLALWSLLENLTVSFASHDDVIKRTLFLYKDKEFHKQILEHLKSYRNKTVHSGDSVSEEIEILLFQLKGYVETLLRFHLSNKLKFSDMKESFQFLNISTDKNELTKKIEFLSKAKKFLHKS